MGCEGGSDEWRFDVKLEKNAPGMDGISLMKQVQISLASR